MATMVDVSLIEINSCTLKRIEGNDEAAKASTNRKAVQQNRSS